jgi:hypothetical protein
MSNNLIPGASHFIPLSQAIEMTTLYRNEKEAILVPAMRDKKILPTCETFNREAFDALLGEPGCVGLRFYLGMDDGLKVKIIAVGVNAANEDMLPEQAARAMVMSDPNQIVEDGQRCPDDCPPASPLNS